MVATWNPAVGGDADQCLGLLGGGAHQVEHHVEGSSVDGERGL
jgi:hypothetical protein